MPKEFISTYQCINEKTSSSPSGHHTGHYKAILHDTILVGLHAAMMSLPFQVGFVPTQWSKFTDIMLAKDIKNFCFHRLQIIAFSRVTTIKQNVSSLGISYPTNCMILP